MTWMRLNISVEGQTEEEFVKELLLPLLAAYNVGVSVRMLGGRGVHSRVHKGGLRKFARLHDDVARWMREDKGADARFTTMVDLYAYPVDAPEYDKGAGLPPYEKVKHHEEKLAESLNDQRFIPYIQLYEFETMLFAQPQKWKGEMPGCEKALAKIVKEIETF